MALTTAQIQEQRQQAEELLADNDAKLGFAKGLFFGKFQGSLLLPYPQIKPAEQPALDQALAELRRFADEHIDAAAIDVAWNVAVAVNGGGRDISQLGYL